MNDIATPLNDDELSELDELLLAVAERYEAERGEEVDCVLSVSELDGFFTALISCPSLVLPSEWFPAIWGGETPKFKSEREMEHLFTQLTRHLNGIAGTLAEAPEEFEPLFELVETDEGQEQIEVDAWCYGYLRGIGLREQDWDPLMEDQPELIMPLLLFAGALDPAFAEELDAETTSQLQEQLPQLVRDIYAHWEPARTAARQPVKNGPKIGRNDPCPCGSGRKYKQCCLH